MAELLIIAGKESAQGFRLGGFDVIEVDASVDMDGLIEEVTGGGRYGLVFVEERFLEEVSRRVMRHIMKRGLPVLIPMDIPRRFDEAGAAESHIARLISRAVGYQVKIRA